MNSLQGPIRLFLNYASEDAEAVEALYDKLNHTPYEPWMDRKNLVAGEDWKRSIERAQRQADFILICLSTRSVSKRGYVQREIHEALDQWKEKLADDIYVIPIRLDDCERPIAVQQFQSIDLFDPSGFTGLLLSIKTGVERRQGTLVQRSESTYLTIRLPEADPNQVAYRFEVDRPSFQPEDDMCLGEINAIVHGFVLGHIVDIRRSVLDVELRDQLRQRGWESTQDFLGISFDVPLLTPTLVSIVFRILENRAGAAHPINYTHVLNFLRGPVRRLSTSHLSGSSSFLPVISEYCYADLLSQLSQNGLILGDDQVMRLKEGTSPKYENFREFVLTREGATIFFDPYSVGPYSIGRMEVRIPRSLIEPLLAPGIRESYCAID